MKLAARAGINVARHELLSVGNKSVAVVTRFDRAGAMRIPFLSSATLLALPQGSLGSYTLIAEAIRQFGHHVTQDLAELWRRLVFSLLASNYDDHPRNHGFLMAAPGRWALSPAYDINPVPEIDRARVNKTPITEETFEPSLAAALEVAPQFGLKPTLAMGTLREVYNAVIKWKETARSMRLKSSTIEAYESAFQHELLDEAKKLLA